jgi:hypothetical protein
VHYLVHWGHWGGTDVDNLDHRQYDTIESRRSVERRAPTASMEFGWSRLEVRFSATIGDQAKRSSATSLRSMNVGAHEGEAKLMRAINVDLEGAPYGVAIAASAMLAWQCDTQ